jgi:hypothetical protein
MDLYRRYVVDTQRLHRIEIRLYHSATIDGDRLPGRGPLDLVFGAAGIDDLAADIAGDPDVIECDVAGRRHRSLYDFGGITQMAGVERHALAGSLGQSMAIHSL